jgi:DNA-directed RNA polymerase alpha subunit
MTKTVVSKKKFDPFSSNFPKTSAPAERALLNAGYTKLEQLADVTVDDLLKLHGFGPKSIRILTEALGKKGLSFKK